MHTQAPPGKLASGNVWFSSVPYGYKGQEVWTYANGTVATSTAVYQLSGLDTIHVVTLQAWVPDHTSDAQHVRTTTTAHPVAAAPTGTSTRRPTPMSR